MAKPETGEGEEEEEETLAPSRARLTRLRAQLIRSQYFAPEIKVTTASIQKTKCRLRERRKNCR